MTVCDNFVTIHVEVKTAMLLDQDIKLTQI